VSTNPVGDKMALPACRSTTKNGASCAGLCQCSRGLLRGSARGGVLLVLHTKNGVMNSNQWHQSDRIPIWGHRGLRRRNLRIELAPEDHG
jgi:hypothetical protein